MSGPRHVVSAEMNRPREMPPGNGVPEPDGPADTTFVERLDTASRTVLERVRGRRWIRTRGGYFIVNPRLVQIRYHRDLPTGWTVSTLTVTGPALTEGRPTDGGRQTVQFDRVTDAPDWLRALVAAHWPTDQPTSHDRQEAPTTPA